MTTTTVSTAAPQRPPLVRLSRFRVRDFRGVEDATLDLGDTTVLMGENNVGKSALLEACAVAFGDRQTTTADLRIDANGVAAAHFCVDLELTPWTGTAFVPDVTDLLGAMVRIDPATQRQRYFVRVMGKPDVTNRNVEVTRSLVDAWDAPTTTAGEALNASQRAELWYSLLDARRDLVDELRSRGSPWAKLLRRLQLSAADRSRFEVQLGTLSSNIAAALPNASSLAASVANLQSVLGGQVSNARLTLLPTALEDLWRTTDLLVTAHNHPELSISRQGMGARSLSSLLAFRAWLEVEIAGRAEPPMLVVTAFEEPEAHLHPQAQRAVFEEIAHVSGQKIVSTHSPYFASVGTLDDFRVVRRRPTVTVRSAQGLATASGSDAKALEQVRRFCLQRNAEMLFARFVILCEGDTDAGVLPELARVWWNSAPAQMGISVVPLDGAGNSATFARFLTKLGIPWILVVDGDQAGTDARNSVSNATDLTAALQNVFQLAHAGVNVDIENLIASTAPNAVARTFGANPRHAAAIANETQAQLAARLASVKGSSSRRLGEELAVEWPTRSAFPQSFFDAFTRADVLLQ